MPGGRPSKYDPDFHPKRYLELCKEGKLKAEICADFGICRDTLHHWENDDSKREFSDAVKKGFSLREAAWIKKGEKCMTGEWKGVAAWIFMMKNAFKYSDRQDVQQTNSGSINIEYVNESDKES